MDNPLIVKWEELHNPKKEEPKKVEDGLPYELPKDFKDKLKELQDTSTVSTTNSNSPYGVTKANPIPSLITYDRQSGEDSFLQIAEKIKNGKAKVSSVSINADAVGGFNTGLRTYTFEVMEWDI